MLDFQELEMVKMQIVAPVLGSLAKPEEMGESLALHWLWALRRTEAVEGQGQTPRLENKERGH